MTPPIHQKELISAGKIQTAHLPQTLRRGWALIWPLLLICLPIAANAHDARPLSVTIVEQATNLYRVVVHAPPSLAVEDSPALIWPMNCDIRESRSLTLTPGSTSLVACANELPSQTLHLKYPDFNPSLTTLFRIETLNGSSSTAVLPPDELSWTIPKDPDRLSVATEYSALGFQHIWEGIDHLLFVAGLLLLARSPKKILYAVTGFTLAHSITLSLATLGLVTLPVSLIEAMIALSILFLASEIARNDKHSFSMRYPISLSFVFGLLHGFGFASALGDISLPSQEIITGLLFFNIGVELGQLSFIMIVCAGLLLLHWGMGLTTNRNISQAVGQPFTLHPVLTSEKVNLFSAYCLGVPAAYWFYERAGLALFY